MIPPIVEQLQRDGLVVESQGAKCIFTSIDEVPLMVVKSDGGFGYDSTDMAAIHHRLITMRADWLIYITDLGQENHFFKIFDAAKQAGWHTPPTTRVDHVGFGVVQGDDGKKFKTRSGETVKLSALLDEAEERAKAEIKERLNNASEGGSSTNVTEEELENASKVIGTSAVKYFDLRQNRLTNYIFSYDKMLDPKGNTAVYLLYAYARICSIIRKSGVDISSLRSGGASIQITHEKERDLALEVLRFPDVIAAILGDLYAHRLPEYMWDLSNKFTSFYMDCKVIGSEEQSSRLLLCEVTRMALEKSFYLLGILPLERM
jgi:arginyl-tRNA synthetase